MARKIAQDVEAYKWWKSLTKEEKADVKEWLKDVDLPGDWTKNGWTEIDYAYTECGRGMFSGRYGRIL